MAALSLNGWTVPLLLEGAQQTPDVGEDAAPSVSGEMIRLRRYIKQKWSIKAGPLTASQKADLFGLALGQCDHWSFDESGTDWQWSEGGIGLLSGTATYATATPSPKYGAGYIDVGTSNLPTFDARIAGAWTLLAWRYESGAWHHHAITSTGDYYEDGAVTGSAPVGLAVTSGSVRLGSTLSTQQWDDLVLLRWAASAELVAAVYAAGAAFRGPDQWATGDLLEADSGGLLVTFDPPTSEYRPFTSAGTTELYGQNATLSMREV